MAAQLRQSCLADPAHKTEPGTCRTCSKGTSGTLAFGPMRAAWVLCSALRCACAALSLIIIGFGFSHSSILRPGPEPPHLPSPPLSPRPAAPSSPSCGRRSWLLPTVVSQSWLSACSRSKPPPSRPCLPRTRSRRHFHLPPSSASPSLPLYSTIALVLTAPAKLQHGHAPPSTIHPSSSLYAAASLSLERLGPAFRLSHHSLPASRVPTLSQTALAASNGRELSTETQFTCKNSTVADAVADAITAFIYILESLGSPRAKHQIGQQDRLPSEVHSQPL